MDVGTIAYKGLISALMNNVILGQGLHFVNKLRRFSHFASSLIKHELISDPTFVKRQHKYKKE
jgi:hypothetical protein